MKTLQILLKIILILTTSELSRTKVIEITRDISTDPNREITNKLEKLGAMIEMVGEIRIIQGDYIIFFPVSTREVERKLNELRDILQNFENILTKGKNLINYKNWSGWLRTPTDRDPNLSEFEKEFLTEIKNKYNTTITYTYKTDQKHSHLL